MRDALVRVRWWDATADALLAQDGLDIGAIAEQLAKRVPMPMSEEELVNMFWPREAAWGTQRRIDHAARARGDVARAVRELVFDALSPGEREWGDALTAWDKAEVAFSCAAWDSYVAHETEALRIAEVAIAKARERHVSRAAEWLGVFHEHVRRLDERRAVRDAEEARCRAEKEARRQREAEERPRPSARGARRRTARPPTTSAGPRSIVDRIANGSPKEWAELLGVKPICSREELRRAHRNAVLRHHPDRGGDEEMMKAVNIAQRRLGDMLEMYWAAGIA